jgi:delta-aminolevulinic acid dehydratase/porphobilinogen synthase
MAFPINRPRRLRRNETLRRMVRETHLSPDDFIQPFFVCPGLLSQAQSPAVLMNSYVAA